MRLQVCQQAALPKIYDSACRKMLAVRVTCLGGERPETCYESRSQRHFRLHETATNNLADHGRGIKAGDAEGISQYSNHTAPTLIAVRHDPLDDIRGRPGH
jgi:hypothetical protein